MNKFLTKLLSTDENNSGVPDILEYLFSLVVAGFIMKVVWYRLTVTGEISPSTLITLLGLISALVGARNIKSYFMNKNNKSH